jgi:hypothetical protein
MKLKPKEKSAILAGEHPEIIRKHEGACPFEFAECIVLRTQPSLAGPVAQVSITIIGRRRGAKGEWIAEYSVRDDRPLYLRHNSGVTRSASESLDPEAAITDEAMLKEYALRGRLANAQRREDNAEARRKRERAIRGRLRETLAGLNRDGQVELLAKIERECIRARNTSDQAA